MTQSATNIDRSLNRPRIIRSANGHEFDVNAMRWQLRDYGNKEIINLKAVASRVTASLFDDIRSVFADPAP